MYKHDVLTKLKMCHICTAPEMFDLMKIVIPEIMNEWEYIAYALHYNIATIRAIKERERENPKKCCEEFFKD